MALRRLTAAVLSVAVFLTITGCSSSSSGPSDTSEDPDVFDIPGLIAFYDFDGDLTDASASGHDGTAALRMHYINDHNGKAQSALYLDDNDYFTVADHSDLDFTGAFSFAVWLMADLENSSYCCFADKGYADEGWSAGCGGSLAAMRKPLYLYVGTHAHSLYLNEAVPVGMGTWVHIACCFNDATDQATFYVDGSYAHTFTATEPVSLNATAYDLRIGNSHWNDQYCGGIDQLAFFDRELTADEVEVLYEYD